MPISYDLAEGNVALLIIDMTTDFLAEGAPMELANGRSVIGNVNALVDRSHELGVPVVFVRQANDPCGVDIGRMADTGAPLVDEQGRATTLRSGTAGVEVYSEVSRSDADIQVDKHRHSGFFETKLDTVLRGLNAKTVLITGIASNGCCYATALDAMARGYQVVFLSDATATGTLPDLGFGVVTAEMLHTVTLTVTRLILGEVADTADVLGRLVEQPASRELQPLGS
jgi:nicotinamidase-related amidase